MNDANLVSTRRRYPTLLTLSILLAGLILLGNIGVTLFVRSDAQKLLLIDLTYPLWDLWAMLGLSFAAWSAVRQSRRHVLGWGCLAAAAGCAGLGNSLWMFLELTQGGVSFPSVPDVFYLLMYPLFLGGVLVLSATRYKGREQLKTGLDLLIVMLTATLVFWRYVLGPAVASVTAATGLGQLVALAYPVGDLVLLWSVLVLLYRRAVNQHVGPVLLLALGMVITIVADGVYAVQAVLATYTAAGLLDISWVLANLVYGIAGVWQAALGLRTTAPDRHVTSSRLSTWFTYLPYLCVIGAYLILESAHGQAEALGSPWLTWGVGVIILLVLLRQLLTLQENYQQAQNLQQINQTLQEEMGERQRIDEQVRQQAQQLSKLNAELQLEMRARARTEKMLYQEQKLESIGLLVGGVAHDFNNLFTSVLGQASLAQRYLTADHKAYHHLEKSVKATQQAAELTRQLLAYTGKSNVQREPLDLNQLVAANRELLDTAIQQTSALILDLQPDLPTIHAATGQIQQVIMNLIINAAQAIQQEAGQITITTRALRLTQAPAPFDFIGPAPTAGDYVRLTVQDNGSGMSQAILDRIFDPYFTTKENGHGLGLSAVLGIVHAHRGSLQVTSSPGQGSCFQIYFPTYQQSTLTLPPVNAVSQRAVNNTTILVIEDQAEVREAAVELFHSAGYHTLQAANGYEGVALFQQQHTTIDLVLLDMVMPGISGLETLAQLRKIDALAKVVLTSGYSEHTLFAQMQHQRPTDFLPKPYLGDTLLTCVATVLSL